MDQSLWPSNSGEFRHALHQSPLSLFHRGRLGWGKHGTVSLNCLPKNPLSIFLTWTSYMGLGAILHPLVFNTDLINSLSFFLNILIEGWLLYRILWFPVTHQQESAIGTPMSPPSWTSLPSPSPSPLQPVTEPLFEFPESHCKFPLAIYFTHGIVNFYVTLSIHLPFSLLSSHCAHWSVLYICFSLAALKINSSVPSLQIAYIRVSIWYLYFSFWLTSLCVIGSRFVRLIRTDSNAFLFQVHGALKASDAT